MPLAFFVDLAIGQVSSDAVSYLFGMEPGFAATFLVACTYGVLLNLALGIYMAMLYPLVRALSPDAYRPGFEVVLPEAIPAQQGPQPQGPSGAELGPGVAKWGHSSLLRYLCRAC